MDDDTTWGGRRPAVIDPFHPEARFAPEEIQARVSEYLQRGETRPLHVDLDLTTACNYACPHCGDLARKLLNRGGLDEPELLALIDDLGTLGVRSVSLIGGGEPTESPHILTVLTALHERGIRAGVVTNGSGLGPALQACLARTCAWVRVSLDAATEGTYRAIHRPLDGSSFVDVVNKLAELSGRMRGRVGASFLIMSRNTSEIADAARLAKRCGCAYIRYRPVQHPITGRFMRLRNLPEIARQLAEARTVADDGFQISESECLKPLLCGGDAIAEQAKGYSRCHAQAFGTVISGDGSVYVCSKWRGDPGARVGNVRETRLTEIWSGHVRAGVVQCLNPSVRCANAYCQAHAYNVLLDARRESADKTRMEAGAIGPERKGASERVVSSEFEGDTDRRRVSECVV